jgi:hypothetical protein
MPSFGLFFSPLALLLLFLLRPAEGAILTTPVDSGTPASVTQFSGTGNLVSNLADCVGKETGSDVWGQDDTVYCTFSVDKSAFSREIHVHDVSHLSASVPQDVPNFRGVKVHYQRSPAFGEVCQEKLFQLRHSGTLLGTNQASAAVWANGWVTRSEEFLVDLTRSTALNAQFGFSLQLESDDAGTAQSCFVSAIRLELVWDSSAVVTTGKPATTAPPTTAANPTTTGIPAAPITTGVPTTTGVPGAAAATTGVSTGVPATSTGVPATTTAASTTTGNPPSTTAPGSKAPSSNEENSASAGSAMPVWLFALIGVLVLCVLLVAAAAVFMRQRRRARGGASDDTRSDDLRPESDSGSLPEEPGRASVYAKTPQQHDGNSVYAKTPGATPAEGAYAKTPDFGTPAERESAYARTPADS